MRLYLLMILGLLGLTGCETISLQDALEEPVAEAGTSQENIAAKADQLAQDFLFVVQKVEPVAESVCRERRGSPCNFQIVVDDRPGQAPNAFQTVDRNGRPILAFNISLIASVQNPDELAFVMGHEASHHILNHLEQQQRYAEAGALILSDIASARGGTTQDVQAAQELGAQIGARTFSKNFELEADELGTRIAAQAGFDPLLGAQFFIRLPDPGNRFLGTHPPNAQRMETVRQAAAAI